MKRISQVTHAGIKYTRKNLAHVRLLVDNQHVSLSEFQLIRMLYPMVKPYPKRLRKMVYQYALECHADNKQLYADVMGGGWGYVGRK